jgi:hypothetical protein
VIPDRPNERLRVSFRVRESDAEETAEKGKTSDMMEFTSDNGEEENKAEDTIDDVLRNAMQEIADVELFDEVSC